MNSEILPVKEGSVIAELNKTRAEKNQLRNALVGLVGADTKPELEAMEAFIRIAPGVPELDRANTLNAIHALIATLP